MDQTSRIFPVLPLRLRVTRPQPCAYLAGQQEQRLAGDISARPEEHDSLAEAGFRRVENWVYKPAILYYFTYIICKLIQFLTNMHIPTKITDWLTYFDLQ